MNVKNGLIESSLSAYSIINTYVTGAFGGLRLARFSMIVDDGKVVKLNCEDGGGWSGVSGAEQMLKDLEALA